MLIASIMSEIKNPKEHFGSKKIPYSYVPAGVLAGLAVAMYEGKKYGRHNYRVIGDIAASIYYDALKRHIDAWWEGEDTDPDSKVGLSHLVKAMACLAVLYDAKMMGKMRDDRPPKLPEGWMNELNEMVVKLNEKVGYVEPFTAEGEAAKARDIG